MDATTTLAREMTERELQRNVRDAAKKLGWVCYTWWSSLHSPRGWPDCIFLRERPSVGDAEIIAIELKSEKGKLSPEQAECHRLLRLAGIEVYVFRPSSWFAGEVEKVLL